MNRYQRYIGLIGLAVVALGFIGKIFYRDFIRTNQINDFYLADMLPSFFYVVGFALLLLIKPGKKAMYIITIVTAGSILYEFYQAVDSRIVQWEDVIASVIGGIIAYWIHFMVHKKTSVVTT